VGGTKLLTPLCISAMTHAYVGIGIIYSLGALVVAKTSWLYSTTQIRMADGFIK
jgi:hypothetical protein